MRYFVYQDAQIMGPFTREDLSQVQGLHRDSLVCAEASMGTKDSEWRSAADVDELSTFFKGGPGVTAAPALELSAGVPPDHFLRASEENRSLFDGFGYLGEWTSGVFEDPDFFRQWGALVDSAATRNEELDLAKLKAEALEKNLDDMTRKLAKYERQQNEILERLNLKDRALEEKEKAVKALETRLPELERSLELARQELRLAKERLTSFQSGAASMFAPAPAPAPVRVPEAVAPPPPPPLPVAESKAAPPADEEIRFDEPPILRAAPPPPPPAPAPEPAPIVFESPIPEAPSHKPRFELAPAIRLKSSTLQAAGTAFVPPVPSPSAPAPAEVPPAASLESLPDFFPQRVATPPAAQTPKAAEPPPAPAAEAAPPAPAELPPNWAADPLALAGTMPPQAEPGPAASAPEPALQPPVALPTPEPEPIVFSPEPAQPPETLVQRRAPAATPPPAFQDLLAAAPDAAPWGPPAPAADPAGELAAILPPEPMPGQPAEPAPGPGAAPAGGLVELTLSPPPLPASMEPEPVVSAIPEAAAPATLEPVGPLQTPRTTIRSLGGPAPGQPQPASKALFPDMATPAPVAAAPGGAPPIEKPVQRGPAPTTQGGLPGPETQQRRRQSKTFLIVLGGAFACLLSAGVFFLKDPKEVIKLFTMGPEKSRPVDPEQMVGDIKPASLGEVKPVAVQNATPAQPPNAQPPAVTGGKVPPGRDFIADSSLAAIDFAKKQPAGKGKKGVAEWLRSSLVKRGDEEEWSAGAVEANIYLVSYRYFKGGRAAKQEPLTYLFEVDLDKKTIKGRNPLAKELMGGAAPKPIVERPAKRVKKSRPAAPDAPPDREPQTPGAAGEEPAPLDDILGPPGTEPAAAPETPEGL